LEGGIGFEQGFFIIVIAPEFYLPLRMLGQRFHASAIGVAAARSIFQILDEPVSGNIQVYENDDTENNHKIIVNPPYEIEFQHVSYSYPGRENEALNRVSFTIKPGQQTAIVGGSGMGKTTIARCLLGLAIPSSGEIFVNGDDMNQISMDLWRSNLAWVPQNPSLFNKTLRENIILGNSQVQDEAIREALHMADLEEWVKHLPRGLETNIGEGGMRLSGGQAQRVVLARAFLRQAAVIVMDEASAHLDFEQEERLIEVMRRVFQRKTVLIIAHRMSTIKNADQIVVVENGTVAEIGKHEDLIRHQGNYYHLLAAYQEKEE
jgi:ATP-binding cassette, subfamily C, bacterial CydD